ncbi:hypothetical protein I7I48_02744 [Histoplasma ohiense]|nr:hypothetical protein I7I48_02744 [Histoplasma ohiense (nom. inval.)]
MRSAHVMGKRRTDTERESEQQTQRNKTRSRRKIGKCKEDSITPSRNSRIQQAGWQEDKGCWECRCETTTEEQQ